MNEESIFSNDSQMEAGEGHDVEKQELDEATHEPRSAVEQKGDYEQAEAIQKSLEDLPMPCCPPGDLPQGSGTLAGEDDTVEMADLPEAGNKEFTGPEIRDVSQEEVDLMMIGSPPDWDHGPPKYEIDLEDKDTIDTSQLEYEPGPVQQPPDWDHSTPPNVVKLETDEGEGLIGRQPKVREDLGNLKPVGSDDDDKDEATPINLPNPQAIAEDLGATPLPIPHPEDQSITGREAQVRGDLDQVTYNEGGGSKDEATPINLPSPQAAAENVGHLPIPLPQPADAEDAEQVGHMPIPLPRPADEGLSSEDANMEDDGSGSPKGNQVASEDDWEAPIANQLGESPDPGGNPPGPNQVEKDHLDSDQNEVEQ